MAIAGGVNVMLRPESSVMLSKAGFLNPDQYCKAFDAAANGYVRGEGAGVVILKPLSKAVADGDAIYAWVRGSAVNQDGFLPEGFTVPNVFSQIELLESVYAEAGIDPLSVDYVEAHGTGTPVGDPIESLALGAVLGRERDEDQRRLIIGSVKTNIGHLEGAAGIAGFIKGVLTAQHGIVPPNLHFHNPNPEIDWDNLNLEVPTQPNASGSQWPSEDYRCEFVRGGRHQRSRRAAATGRCPDATAEEPGLLKRARFGRRDVVHAQFFSSRFVENSGSKAC